MFFFKKRMDTAMAWKSQRGKEIFSIGLWTGQLGVGHKEGVQIQAMDMGEAFHHPPPPRLVRTKPHCQGEGGPDRRAFWVDFWWYFSAHSTVEVTPFTGGETRSSPCLLSNPSDWLKGCFFLAVKTASTEDDEVDVS